VARGLYARAIGYERKVEREILHHGELKTITNTAHYPPNTQACIFWLRNWRRRTWRVAPDDPPAVVDLLAAASKDFDQLP
jgi:hypothetical protein